MAHTDTQVLKGILSMLLLRVLHDRADYGYAVVVRLRDLGFDDLAEGTVYPALTRLESRGLLDSWLEPSNAGPARKYYRPTAAGVDELGRATRAWVELTTSIDHVMAATADDTTHVAHPSSTPPEEAPR